MLTEGGWRWARLEIYLLGEYMYYWDKRTKAKGLLKFNEWLCFKLIYWHMYRLKKKPPVFKPWYVWFCHTYYRWRKI